MGNSKYSEKLARLLDSQFTIPGTKWRFGLDPILGLIPGVGDGISMIFQGYLVYMLNQRGASGKLVALMSVNVLLDTLIGAIPVIGQLWDFWFKANQRNLKLANEYWHDGKHRGKGTGIWLGIILLLIFTIVAVIWLIAEIIEWLVDVLA